MATDETRTTESPEPEDGDALEETATTETEDEGSRDAESEKTEPDWKAIALGYKTKVEEANELKRRLEALESRSSQSPAAPSTQTEIDEDEQQLRAAAATPEGFWARKMLKEREERQDLIQGLVYQRQMKNLTDEEQEAAVAEWNKKPHLYASPLAAHEGIKAKKLEGETARLQKEMDEMRKRLQAFEKKRDPAVEEAVPHGSREAATKPQSREWTEAQWDAERDRILQTKGELAALKFDATAPSKWRN